MNNTINYNLKKPDINEYVDINDINDNMDTIDAALAELQLKKSAGDESGNALNSLKFGGKLPTEYASGDAEGNALNALKLGGKLPNEYAGINHNHAQSEITGLENDISSKSNWNGQMLSGSSVKEWAMSTTCETTGAIDVGSGNDVPYDGHWLLSVDVAMDSTTSHGWRRLTATNVLTLDMWYCFFNVTSWTDWMQINTSAIGGARITTGSYIGTGTYGASNPCSITFDFEPKLVLITSESYIGTIDVVVCMRNASFAYTHRNQTSYYIRLVWSGKTLSWTDAGNSAIMQLNASGATYKYVAIG